MICPNSKGNIELVGLPVDELDKPIDKRQPRHYLLGKLNTEQLVVLSETSDDPGVPREIVVYTKTKVICRFIYDDEDEQEVIKSWIKIEKRY